MGCRKLSDAEKVEVYEDIRTFLSDELDVPVDQIKAETRILDDLKGDSMIYLELVQEFKRKFDLNVEVRVIGLYFQRNPVYTVGEVAQAVCDIVEHGDELVAKIEAELSANNANTASE